MTNFQKAKKLLRQGDVIDAIKALPANNELILCLARMEDADQKLRLGVLSHSDYQLTKIRVCKAIDLEINRIENYRPSDLLNCVAELNFDPIKKSFRENDLTFSWTEIDNYLKKRNSMKESGEMWDAKAEQSAFDKITPHLKRLIEKIYRLGL